jgi:hypothetical protein
MSVVTKLQIVVLALAVCSLVVGAQSIAMSRIYQSWGWWILAGAFICLGGRQAWEFIMLPEAIMKAQARGDLATGLPWIVWVRIAWAFLIFGLFITALDKMRRDLRKHFDI